MAVRFSIILLVEKDWFLTIQLLDYTAQHVPTLMGKEWEVYISV